MLGWSINLFRVKGILLSLHFSFLLLLAWVGWDGWNRGGMEGLLWSVATILAIFTCVVLHELGHSLTATRFGIRVRRILLMPIGGMAEFESIPKQPGREFLITAAGPAVNFAIAGALYLAVGLPRGWLGAVVRDQLDIPATATGFAHLLIIWNLLMGLFNLLPSFPMDGGRILRAILATRMTYLRATFWAATVGKVICLAGIIYAAYHSAPLAAVLFAFIFVAGEAEYRSAKRREVMEEHYRLYMERARRVPPDEPPVVT